MSAQTSLTAFQGIASPERAEPEDDHGREAEPAQDYDGLQAVAAAVAPGFSTTQAREDRGADRVVSQATCPRCGAPYDGPGICPEHAAEGDLVDDPFRTSGGGR